MSCGVCGGSGKVESSVLCTTCSGSGQHAGLNCAYCGGSGARRGVTTCTWCGGSGGLQVTNADGDYYQPRQGGSVSFGKKVFFFALQVCVVSLMALGAMDLLATGSLWRTIRGVSGLALSALWVLVPLVVLWILFKVLRRR